MKNWVDKRGHVQKFNLFVNLSWMNREKKIDLENFQIIPKNSINSRIIFRITIFIIIYIILK